MSGPYSSAQWQRLRLKILERDGYKCQVRGPKCKGVATAADHIIPTSDGGAMFDPANLRAACQWCNTWRAKEKYAAFYKAAQAQAKSKSSRREW